MGVRRAVDLALRAATESQGGKVFTLGPLIHNPQTVEELRRRGVEILREDRIDGGLPGATVVVRAHGAPPSLVQAIEAAGARVVDATCPRVLASQRTARRLHENGYLVVIAGDADHGEVAGIRGCAPGSLVAADAEEAGRLARELAEDKADTRIALIAQTTIREEEYADIRREIERCFPALVVVESICPATKERREALRSIAGSVDAVVVVGGRASANTVRLLKLALALGLPAWQVETAKEIPEAAFGYGTVGLTAGASTPDALVDEVEAALSAGMPPARPWPPVQRDLYTAGTAC